MLNRYLVFSSLTKVQDQSSYDPTTGYSQSNAARVMFVKKLAQRLAAKKIRTYSIDPGGLFTSLHMLKTDLMLKCAAAVLSGLQRHFTPEIKAWVDNLLASGESKFPSRDIILEAHRLIILFRAQGSGRERIRPSGLDKYIRRCSNHHHWHGGSDD